jgi:cytoskeletal protein RodZ
MKTVSQILSSERKRKKWTLEEVYKFTKINPVYIKALESGDYSTFNGKVHAKGFLKIYAQFLELDIEELLAFWRREYEGEYERGVRGKKITNLKKSVFPTLSKITLGYKSLSALTAVLLVIGFFTYILYQYNKYSKDPILIVSSPKDGVVVRANFVDVVGNTEAESEMYLNNQVIPLDESGNFTTVIQLTKGTNTLTFSVKNRLGSVTTKKVTVTYKPEREIPIVEVGNESSESSPTTLDR